MFRCLPEGAGTEITYQKDLGKRGELSLVNERQGALFNFGERTLKWITQHAPVGDEFGMDADDVGEELRLETGLVVLAEASEARAEVAMELHLVFAELTERFGHIQGPGHLASGAEAGETVGEGGIHLAFEIGDHFRGFEDAVFQIALFAGEDLEGTAALRGLGIDSGAFEAVEDAGDTVFVGDVEAALVAFESISHVGTDPMKLFVPCFENEGNMIARLNRRCGFHPVGGEFNADEKAAQPDCGRLNFLTREG